MPGKAIAYFFLGFVSALAIIELTDGKPPVRVNYYDVPLYRYNYNEIYPYGYYRYQHNPYSRGNNSGVRSSSDETTGRSHSGNTNTFNHTAQERTESWGTKN
jgi:hypothetical protein|tara:strand:- start:28 stop:333 length:306 start_codon:yes stop_codon:yes gene_type:complete